MRILQATTLLAFSLLLLPPIGTADIVESSSCLRDELERHVELRRDNPEGVPCQVVYVRSAEKVPEKALWFANNDASYCKTQYDNFLIKLESKLNWNCTTDLTAAPTVNELTGYAPLVPSTAATSSVDETATAVENPIVSTEPVGNAAIADSINAPARIEELSETLPRIEVLTPSPNTNVSPKQNNSAELVEPQRQLEPVLQAALPTSPIGNNSSRPDLALPVKPSALNKDTLSQYIPSGFYSQDPDRPHSGDANSCPAPGYFVWNTRNPTKPVFELGKTLEFELNLLDMQSLADATVIVLPTSSTDGSDSCITQINFGSCQHPEFREGTANWPVNDRSFDCNTTADSSRNRIVNLALFQNRTQVLNDSTCPAASQVTHMALASLTHDAQNFSDQAPGTIELTINTSRISSRCSYIRNAAQ